MRVLTLGTSASTSDWWGCMPATSACACPHHQSANPPMKQSGCIVKPECQWKMYTSDTTRDHLWWSMRAMMWYLQRGSEGAGEAYEYLGLPPPAPVGEYAGEVGE